jgi:hypothetical protein
MIVSECLAAQLQILAQQWQRGVEVPQGHVELPCTLQSD